MSCDPNETLRRLAEKIREDMIVTAEKLDRLDTAIEWAIETRRDETRWRKWRELEEMRK